MVALASGAMGLDGSLRIVGAPGATVATAILAPRVAAMARGSGFRLAPQIIPKGWNTLKMRVVVVPLHKAGCHAAKQEATLDRRRRPKARGSRSRRSLEVLDRRYNETFHGSCFDQAVSASASHKCTTERRQRDTRMMEYRVFRVAYNGQISELPAVFACASDEEAVEVARAITPISSVEIWQGARFIVSLPRSADQGDRKA